ncbi:M14 family zinc carboxypeptidase [Defluviimonas sp. D31]|uniref:M14 family zinc carboxypeptidase n=1 Tax=Defluviimonas sp. D31 TaxID=3083253 RepID=UPI00296EA3E2|nr:M14 family zinc carboxypeptidase [Defluviimonas sp. D31]MDW4550726.1 M14 family zinc carboxypeptidase [Defluviimonas sp. D31]
MAYHNLTELEAGLTALGATYPATCQLINLPNPTVEGRTVRAVRIGTPGDKLAVLFLAGLHAREWMPPEICMSLAADLLEAYDMGTGLTYGPVNYSAAEVAGIMETFHLYFIPTANPDGYNHSKSVDSIGGLAGWRRNRNPAQSGGNPSCVGVDLNRNYDVLFNYPSHLSPAADLRFISTDPCDLNQVYHGPSPNSEQETNNVVWMLDTFPKIRWFFDIHSYSELILYPWGHDEVQTTDPSQNFLNPMRDGARGVPGDAYSEYVDANALSVHQALAEQIRVGIQAVNGNSYSPGISFGLYPTTGTSSDYAWSRHIADPLKARVFSFTIETGTAFRPPWAEAVGVIAEVSSGFLRFLLEAPCVTWPLTVTAPSPLEIVFADVPEGLTTYRAVVFEVTGCSPATVRIVAGPTVTSGPPSTAFGTPSGLVSATADPRPNFETPAYARAWISYTGTSDGDVATGTVRIRCDATGQEWDVLIRANTRARPTVAVMLALDQSGSMDDPAGDLGATRLDVLREAAVRFMELIPANNGVGLVRFDHDAYPVGDATYPGLPMTPILSDDMSDMGRSAARSAAALHATNPAGWTSIGDGVVMARSVLTPVTGYDEKAIIVFTDGIENRPLSIADALGSIDARTFAIGLGTETQVSTAGLMALAGVRDGYLLLTGHLTTGTDDYFRLTKYFHQILAGATRTDIVRDPSGYIGPGMTVRIPVSITEADVEMTAILLVDAPVVRFRLETPGGDIVDPGVAGSVGATFATGTRMAFYRIGLPLPIGASGAREGVWHAVLEVDEKAWKRYFANPDTSHGLGAGGPHPLGARYNVSFHAYSNIRMQARLDQSGLEPGALLSIRAILTEYDVPLTGRAEVIARVELPDRSIVSLPLAEVAAGMFEASMTAAQAGLYRIQVETSGNSRRGLNFTREQSMTAAVFRGGDRPLPSDADLGRGGEDICRLVDCLLSQDLLRKLLTEKGLDPDGIRKCFEAYCSRRREPKKGEAARWTDDAGTFARDLLKLMAAVQETDVTADLRAFFARYGR